MANAILSALLQLGLVLVLAFVIYLIARRPGHSFGRFIGLTAAPPKAVIIGALVGLVTAFAVLQIPSMAEIASREGTTGHKAALAGGPVPMLVIALSGALIQTALTEEILFRGVIGRNLIRRIGFAWGNFIQAALFGAVHALIALIPGIGPGLVVFAVLFSGATGWLNGWLNEKLGDGSILPGWAAHAVANFTTYMFVAWMLQGAG